MIALVGFIIDIAIAGPFGPEPIVSAVIVIAHYIPSLAIIVRRLHDSDKSGWLVLVCLIPLVGLIAFIVFGCMGSTPSPNRFGVAPAGSATSATATHTGGAAVAPGSSPVERMEKAAALRASGAITEEEFAKMKADILGLR